MAQQHHHEEERDRPRQHDEDARVGRAPQEKAEDDEHADARADGQREVTRRLQGHDGQDGAAVDGDEDEERCEDPQVLPEHVLVTAQAAREDREDRLQLELTIERRCAEDDRHEDGVEGHRRRADVGHDARLLTDRHGGDHQGVDRGGESERQETEEHASTNRLAVGVHGDGRNPSEHQLGRPVKIARRRRARVGRGPEKTTFFSGRGGACRPWMAREELSSWTALSIKDGGLPPRIDAPAAVPRAAPCERGLRRGRERCPGRCRREWHR